MSAALTAAQRQAQALAAQAEALRQQGRWADALAVTFEAAEADPDNAAIAHNLATLLTKYGRLAEGEAYERRALALAPDATVVHGLAHNLLAQGRLAEAWPLYGARVEIPELNDGIPRNFPFPRWQGEDLAGKRIAVFPEQGYGDQIQLARFLPRLIALGAQVTLLTRLPLVELFSYNFPGLDVVPAEGSTDFPDPDYWATIYDLPGIFGATLDSLPGVPYLAPPVVRALPGDNFRIGFRDKGNPRHVNDLIRSLPEDIGGRLRDELPGTIVDLDPDATGAGDFAETAAIVAGLDLIVSVDTSVAHLAGALGKPTFLLLPGFSPDWRWMFGRDDSPWYPRHRLYRSEIDGNWVPAVARLIADAHALAAAAGRPTLP